MRKIPPIKAVMTPFPYWIEINASLTEADTMMLEHDISHLPVKENGEIAGVIAAYDIAQARTDGKTLDGLTVAQVCVMNPYIVDMEEPLDNVALHLSNYHIGSAIVTKEDRLAGVFTVNDACRFLAEFLRDQFRNLGGDDIA
ncbi:MAG: CBS domain-containing protein [Gammaproteobacteria bacterium]|nr:CBS domain-containing protein [Gammaproteobacteria bacterium]